MKTRARWTHLGCAVLVCATLASCYSYRLGAGQAPCAAPLPLRTAYVYNPQLAEEYVILEQAQIFRLVGDTADPATVRLRLLPMQRTFVCLNPIVGWAIFLGQVPMRIPRGGIFEFEEWEGARQVTRSCTLRVDKRYWFWDLFSARKNYRHIAGAALKQSYCAASP